MREGGSRIQRLAKELVRDILDRLLEGIGDGEVPTFVKLRNGLGQGVTDHLHGGCVATVLLELIPKPLHRDRERFVGHLRAVTAEELGGRGLCGSAAEEFVQEEVQKFRKGTVGGLAVRAREVTLNRTFQNKPGTQQASIDTSVVP